MRVERVVTIHICSLVLTGQTRTGGTSRVETEIDAFRAPGATATGLPRRSTPLIRIRGASGICLATFKSGVLIITLAIREILIVAMLVFEFCEAAVGAVLLKTVDLHGGGRLLRSGERAITVFALSLLLSSSRDQERNATYGTYIGRQDVCVAFRLADD